MVGSDNMVVTYFRGDVPLPRTYSHIIITHSLKHAHTHTYIQNTRTLKTKYMTTTTNYDEPPHSDAQTRVY